MVRGLDDSRMVFLNSGRFDRQDREKGGTIGSLSNPGSRVWEDLLDDRHPYQKSPHTAPIIETLRTLGNGRPYFMSEYGVGSAVDLVRLMRHYEHQGKDQGLDALAYNARLEMFMKDWQRWKMEELFGTPEHYFKQCLAKMANQRLVGLNALRANPNIVGYSMSSTVDQGLTAEGVFSTFRELKPGSVDALVDGWAPLRWCLFVNPVHVYNGDTVQLDAVIANEDVLKPGIAYPARIKVVDPRGQTLYEKRFTFEVPDRGAIGSLPPLAFPVHSDEVRVDGPSGQYRMLAALEHGGAAYGEEVAFHVMNREDLPAVDEEVVLWGDDAELASWLKKNGIAVRRFDRSAFSKRELILASTTAATPGGKEAFTELAVRIARGCSVVFLSPAVFRKSDQEPVGWVPLADKGAIEDLPSWLYITDQWAHYHPIFDGLPRGLLDYRFYREIIPEAAWSQLGEPAEVVAGAINTTLGYGAGLLVSVHELDAGRFVLNTLHIRDNLGRDPVAERLLRNLLNFGARDLDRPLVDLPGDFDQKLQAVGYR